MTLQAAPQERINSKTASSVKSLRPEIDLLLCCIRTRTDTATAAQIQNLLQKDLNWAYLLQKALQHGVFLLLYESLQKTHPELIPKNIVPQLHACAQIKTARNLFLAKELCQILDLLADRNISAIPFKGPVLATLAYGNLALREFCDLDILVRKDDFLKAKEVLICQGYQGQHSPKSEAAWSQTKLVRDDRKVNIDLHYNVAPRDFFFSLDGEPFWQRLVPLSLAGNTVATFSPEDSLLVAYIHGSKEHWVSLKRICDLAELIRAYPEMNWTQIIDKVDVSGNQQRFLFALLLAHHYLKIPLPQVISQKVKALPELQSLTEQHYKQVVCGAEMGNIRTCTALITFFSQMVSTDSWWVKMQHTLDVFGRVNYKDRELLPLPTSLSLFYYPLRLLRLIKTYKMGKKEIIFLWNFLRSG